MSDFNGAVAFLDPATRRRLALHRPTGGTLGGPLASAPDGSRVAAAAYDAAAADSSSSSTRGRSGTSRKLRLDIFCSQVESAVFTPDSQAAPRAGRRLGGRQRALARGRANGAPATRPDRVGAVSSSEPMPGDSRLLGFAGSRLVTYSLARAHRGHPRPRHASRRAHVSRSPPRSPS